MVDTKNLMDSKQAAAYINDGLQKKRGQGWKYPISSLGVAVKKGQIQPVEMPGDADLQRIPRRYFTRQECDRFVAACRNPGNQPTDLTPILDRLGQVPDTELAREVGCHPRTIARERRRRGIAKWKSH